MSSYLWMDVLGHELSSEDKEILAHPSIFGVILFAKNFESIAQLYSLTQSIKSISSNLMIAVDQEGGRVQRFRDGFTELPAMSHWGRLYQSSAVNAEVLFKKTLCTMVEELRAVGVDANLAPVLDLNHERSQIIGERSFGSDPSLVTKLANIFIGQMHQLKMPVVGKHFPGHGWVVADSHLELPVDDRDWEVIHRQDLVPFSKLAHKLDAIMPAHVVYSKIDALPAGFSPFWIQTVLRKRLGFEGLVVTDDLTMQGAAVFGDYATRAEMALDAGADVLCVCNNRDGVIQILDRVKKPKSTLSKERLRRYCRFIA